MGHNNCKIRPRDVERGPPCRCQSMSNVCLSRWKKPSTPKTRSSRRVCSLVVGPLVDPERRWVFSRFSVASALCWPAWPFLSAILGVVGFVVMLAGAVLIYFAFTRRSSAAAEDGEKGTDDASAAAPPAVDDKQGGRSSGFMDRMEERWRKRADGDR